MKYKNNVNQRRSIRLKAYNYSQEGLYFITICTQNRECLFGEIIDDNMILNKFGEIAKKCLLEISEHYSKAKMHQFIVMPNHIHCIVEITVGANNYSPLQKTSPNSVISNNYSPHGTSKTIGSIVCGFKIGVTKWFRGNTDIQTIWQRNYYEYVIRNEKSYLEISEYIIYNQLNWKDDKYYI